MVCCFPLVLHDPSIQCSLYFMPGHAIIVSGILLSLNDAVAGMTYILKSKANASTVSSFTQDRGWGLGIRRLGAGELQEF